MGRRIEPLSVKQWIEAGRKLKEAKAALGQMQVILSGHVPAALLDQVLRVRGENFWKLQSRLEDEMFQQHPELPNGAIGIFYGEGVYAERT
ncbi:MAG: hypothetical protein ACYCYP_07940 [Leptospirales bacterium]